MPVLGLRPREGGTTVLGIMGRDQSTGEWRTMYVSEGQIAATPELSQSGPSIGTRVRKQHASVRALKWCLAQAARLGRTNAPSQPA